jgi:uncharacterized protein YjbI with pentapeptide repeats
METNQNREENIQRLLGLLKQRRDSNDPLSIPINFVGANLEGFDIGDLELGPFQWANLEDANLERANLEGAVLTWANLAGANLAGANLENVTFNPSNLDDANLERAYLKDAHFGKMSLKRANLITANLENANLEGAYLQDARFGNTKLNGANLRRANLEGVDLGWYNQLDDTNLTNANLQRANLEGAYLRNSNFTEANLTDANLEESRLRNAIFTRTILTRANLNDANLEGANINDAADLTDVDLDRAFFNTREYNEAFEYENTDDENDDYIPQQGVAYEIHNSFAKFEPLKNQYLEIINQPNKQYGNIYSYIQEKFTTNIRTLFPNDNEKLNQFTTAFDRINTRISENYNDLIGKSIDFAFSQDDNFKKEYLITFLDESCNAYSGSGDNTSCVKGIIERFILSIGSTVQILCAEGCDNETYQKLDKLFNPKFNIAEAANDWWTNIAETDEIKNMSKEERMDNFKNYLRNKAKELNNYNDDIEQKITNYANEIDYSFENLALGGRKTKKTKRTMKNKKPVKSKRNKKSKKSIRSKKSRKTIRYNHAKKSRKTRKARKH